MIACWGKVQEIVAAPVAFTTRADGQPFPHDLIGAYVLELTVPRWPHEGG